MLQKFQKTGGGGVRPVLEENQIKAGLYFYKLLHLQHTNPSNTTTHAQAAKHFCIQLYPLLCTNLLSYRCYHAHTIFLCNPTPPPVRVILIGKSACWNNGHAAILLTRHNDLKKIIVVCISFGTVFSSFVQIFF